MSGEILTYAGLHGWITRLPCGKTIEVEVIHAEGGSIEDDTARNELG